jgi:ABC-2 type transport system permease protein
MSFKRMWAMFVARNYEFFRDKAAFGWNFAFPFLIIIGFGITFGGKDYKQFKIGVFPADNQALIFTDSLVPLTLQNNKQLQFVPFTNREQGEEKLRHHKIDLLLDKTSTDHAYWINDSSPNGYLTEQIYLVSLLPTDKQLADKRIVQGEQIRYIDWFFPGVMVMNMMFSALWGVGYVVVRYRKNGTLKRLKATPLTAFEYVAAQMLSRIFLLMFTLCVVWFGSNMIFHFRIHGSYPLIFFLFFLGGLNLCGMGLVLAARGTSEEFTSGVLNFISWPMMFLSEVWFSLEGAPKWIHIFSEVFPLTQLLRAIRKVMNDGASIDAVQSEVGFLVITTVIFLSIAAFIFSWND